MRHEQIQAKDTYSVVDIAAVWPAGIELAPLPLAQSIEVGKQNHPGVSPAVPDLPVTIGKFIVIAYAGLIAAFALATVGSRESVFMIVISALFVAMFFTVPRIILGVEPKSGNRPRFDQFMHAGMSTHTGHCSGRAALIQILIVPVCLTVGVLAMGVAASIYF